MDSASECIWTRLWKKEPRLSGTQCRGWERNRADQWAQQGRLPSGLWNTVGCSDNLPPQKQYACHWGPKDNITLVKNALWLNNKSIGWLSWLSGHTYAAFILNRVDRIYPHVNPINGINAAVAISWGDNTVKSFPPTNIPARTPMTTQEISITINPTYKPTGNKTETFELKNMLIINIICLSCWWHVARGFILYNTDCVVEQHRMLIKWSCFFTTCKNYHIYKMTSQSLKKKKFTNCNYESCEGINTW